MLFPENTDTLMLPSDWQIRRFLSWICQSNGLFDNPVWSGFANPDQADGRFYFLQKPLMNFIVHSF